MSHTDEHRLARYCRCGGLMVLRTACDAPVSETAVMLDAWTQAHTGARHGDTDVEGARQGRQNAQAIDDTKRGPRGVEAR